MKDYNLFKLTIILPLIILAISTQASSTLTITVKTNKPTYQIDENIEVNGNLTYNGAPVVDNTVAIEVHDPNGNPVVLRSAQTDSYGAYNLTFKLPSDARQGYYKVYASSRYRGETVTSNTTFKLVMSLVQTTVEIEGQYYTITTESNTTITNATANKNALYFKSSGTDGETAYANTTLPKALNKTEIRVFVDKVEITAPFPTITENTTHYFVYFEFALSIREITVQYATTNIAITNLTFSKQNPVVNEEIRICITIQNQGHYNETFDLYLYYTRTYDPLIGYQTITLIPGETKEINFTWTPTTTGRYEIKAYTGSILDEMDLSDNIRTAYLYVVSNGASSYGGSHSKFNLIK